MKPINPEAYKLLHRGCIALAQVERNGIRVDVEYIKRMMKKTQEKIDLLDRKMRQTEIGQLWVKRCRSSLNWDSAPQLSFILFEEMGYKPVAFTDKSGEPKTDEESLSCLDLPFIKLLLTWRKLMKARNTYLKGILRETTDGFVHPFFNLNIARTYRSSSSDPNFQNIPIRDPRVAKLIRRAFIPRDGGHIVEIDFKGAEISAAACYHHDPVMIDYLNDETKDLHRDMAGQLYMLEPEQVAKMARYCGKNRFVFPQFYGDWYMSCAAALWEGIDEFGLEVDGVGLKDHLAEMGIEERGACDPEQETQDGTFEQHVKNVENDFWNNRFKVYSEWKKTWYQQYQEKGYFDTLTGFRVDTYCKRKEVINYPIQGTAFHWLLWSLIRLQKKMNRYHMKSLLCGQIHDSIVGDIRADELQDYLSLAQEVIYEDLPKHWPWICVPLGVEAEVAPLGKSWFEKKEVRLAA